MTTMQQHLLTRSLLVLLSLVAVILSCTSVVAATVGGETPSGSLLRKKLQQQHKFAPIQLTSSQQHPTATRAPKAFLSKNTKNVESFHNKTTSTAGLYVPIYVMMPLDIISLNGALNNFDHLCNQLRQLKSIGVDGIMIDVWWGIVQRQSMDTFNWTPYDTIFQFCKQIGLKVQANLAFHQCGTNVGDTCYIPLPEWILSIANSGVGKDQLFYVDKHGHVDMEYLSLGTGTINMFGGGKWNSVDLYERFMRAFQSHYAAWIDGGDNGVIVSVEIGLGPAGELRYPSYQLQDNLWNFPGVGEFQCYDKQMLRMLNDSAYRAGHPEWGKAGPNNAGNYNSQPPYNIPFFAENNFDNWESDYGKFFLSWYSKQLVEHGDRIMARAHSIFVQPRRNSTTTLNGSAAAVVPPVLAAKIAGIHWWYNSRSHAAELTAGYYNTDKYDGYRDIAQMLKKYDAEFAFTCLEMLDQNLHGCDCSAQKLVTQTRNAAWSAGLRYSGENALPIYNSAQGYDQIVAQSVVNGKAIHSFTYLRLDDQLFQSNAWNLFRNFVQRMHNL